MGSLSYLFFKIETFQTYFLKNEEKKKFFLFAKNTNSILVYLISEIHNYYKIALY